MRDVAFRIAELERMAANLLRIGTVDAVDAAKARVRVRCGNLLTAWIPWLTRRSGGDREWWAPEAGEQVMLLSPCGDLAQAVALPAIYRTASPAPESNPDICRVEFADGAYAAYDRSGHALTVAVPGGTVSVIAPEASFSGNLSVGGDLSAGGDLSVDGNAETGGDLDVGGNITATGTNPNHHSHG